jgi:hypothetical protein
MMTKDEILRAAAEYAATLRDLGHTPRQADPDRRFDVCSAESRREYLDHILWACEFIPKMIGRLGGVMFALRWIGGVQGALAAYGIVTIAEMREHSNPLTAEVLRSHLAELERSIGAA